MKLGGNLKNEFLKENEAWKSTLSLLSEDNISLKNQLSEVLKNSHDMGDDWMDKIEYYHSRFLEEDQVIRFLRMEINAHENFVSMYSGNDAEIFEKIREMHSRLGQGIAAAKKDYESLRNQFMVYLDLTEKKSA